MCSNHSGHAPLPPTIHDHIIAAWKMAFTAQSNGTVDQRAKALLYKCGGRAGHILQLDSQNLPYEDFYRAMKRRDDLKRFEDFIRSPYRQALVARDRMALEGYAAYLAGPNPAAMITNTLQRMQFLNWPFAWLIVPMSVGEQCGRRWIDFRTSLEDATMLIPAFMALWSMTLGDVEQFPWIISTGGDNWKVILPRPLPATRSSIWTIDGIATLEFMLRLGVCDAGSLSRFPAPARSSRNSSWMLVN